MGGVRRMIMALLAILLLFEGTSLHNLEHSVGDLIGS